MSVRSPILQVALDVVNLAEALKVAREAVAGGAQWLEAGTPLIKSEGLEAVRALRREFHGATVIADMKVMDAGRVEVEMAAQAGANYVTVLGVASDSTITECVEAGARYDAQIMVDLAEVADPVARARRLQELGVGGIVVHCPIDVQMRGEDPLALLAMIAEVVEMPIAVAGGINSETAPLALAAGAHVVIVGGAITKAPDAVAATRAILEAMHSGVGIATDLYKRGGEGQLYDMLSRCGAANISDAQHRRGWLPGIQSLQRGMRLCGPAVTVWTYPGDWAKPVEAIDEAPEGAVLVVDVRGEGPAVWGAKASRTAQMRKLAGIVIHGAIRDTEEIRELGFAAFSRLVAPAAGDPKGMGMIGVPIRIGETAVRPGDWVVGDDDGVVVVPRERAVETANRARAIVEAEGREKAEIDQGSTLAALAELRRWEQHSGD